MENAKQRLCKVLENRMWVQPIIVLLGSLRAEVLQSPCSKNHKLKQHTKRCICGRSFRLAYPRALLEC